VIPVLKKILAVKSKFSY